MVPSQTAESAEEEEELEPDADGNEQASVSEPDGTEHRIETWARAVDDAGHGEGDEDEFFALETPFYRFYGDR